MTTVLQFDPANLSWKALAQDPGPVTIGAAVAVKNGRLDMGSGELKPGLRSRHARQFWLNAGGQAQWSQEPIGGIPWEQQDGFAGGYAGYSGDTLLMAGGATFPGSSAQYEKGQFWAHKGLKKTWSDTVYAKTNGKWSVAGKLPEPMLLALRPAGRRRAHHRRRAAGRQTLGPQLLNAHTEQYTGRSRTDPTA